MILLVPAALLGACWAVYRWPQWGIWVFGAAVAMGWLQAAEPAPMAVLAGISVHPLDAASALLLGAAALRAAGAWDGPDLWRNRWLLALALLLTLALAAGIRTFGLKVAGLDARSFITLFAPLAFAAGFADLPEVDRAIRDALAAAALVLAALALYRWMQVAGGRFEKDWAISGAAIHHVPLRVLGSGPTLILAQVSMLLLAGRERKARLPFLAWLPWAGLAMVLVLQHRTVWLATLAGAAVLAWRRRRYRMPSRALWLAAAGLLGVLVALAGRLGVVTEALGRSLQEPLNARSSTLLWRTQGWLELLRPGARTAGDWLRGQPFGVPYLRFLPMGRLVEVSPHSHYVHWLLRTGLAGLLAWIGLWRQAWAGPGRAGRAMAFLVAMQAVYGLAYDLPAEQGLILGWLLVLARVPGEVR